MNPIPLPDFFYYIGIFYIINQLYGLYKRIKNKDKLHEQMVDLTSEQFSLETLKKSGRAPLIIRIIRTIFALWLLIGIVISNEYILFSFILIISVVSPLFSGVDMALRVFKEHKDEFLGEDSMREKANHVLKKATISSFFDITECIINSTCMIIILYIHFYL